MGKECCSNVSSRLWGEALRDETKNGCEGDYFNYGSSKSFLCSLRCFFRMRDVFVKTKSTARNRNKSIKSLQIKLHCTDSRRKLLGQQGKQQEINGTP